MKIKLSIQDIRKVRNNEAVRPHRVKFQLTNGCNARCLHCNLYLIKPDVLKSEIVLKTLKIIKSMGCREVDFTGGEPTLHPDFLKFVKYSNTLGLTVKINSNGYLIDNYCAERLVSYGIREVAISIDSHCPEKHNQRRRLDDGWERAMGAIQNLDKYKKKYNSKAKIVVYSIINKNNYIDTPKILDLKKVANYDEINFIPIKNKENKKDFLSRGELKDFYDRVRPILLKKYSKYGFTGIYRTVSDPFELERHGNNFLSATTGGLYTKKIYQNISCVVPCFYAYIISDGSVTPCCVAPHHLHKDLIMGNINKSDFDSIWNSKRFVGFRKKLRKPSFSICSCCSGHHTDFNIDVHGQIAAYEKNK